MADPHWTGYVGMVTGIIGAITGVTGSIMGYVGYRRSNSLKSLDLRMQLQKEENTAKTTLVYCRELIENANKSRQRVAAATGRFHSSMMEQWKKEIDEDKVKLEDMLQSAQNTDENYEILKEKELETRLVKMHEFQGIINLMKAKYEGALQADDKERDRIRKAHSK